MVLVVLVLAAVVSLSLSYLEPLVLFFLLLQQQQLVTQLFLRLQDNLLEWSRKGGGGYLERHVKYFEYYAHRRVYSIPPITLPVTRAGRYVYVFVYLYVCAYMHVYLFTL